MGRFGRKLARQHQPKPIATEFVKPIERLRQSTIDAEDLDEPWSLFHDELVPTPGFQMAGARAKNPTLAQVIQASAQRVDSSCTVNRTLMIQLGDLWHGMAESSSGPVVFYYFETQDIGLLGFLGKSGSRLVRFSVVALDEPTPGGLGGAGDPGAA